LSEGEKNTEGRKFGRETRKTNRGGEKRQRWGKKKYYERRCLRRKAVMKTPRVGTKLNHLPQKRKKKRQKFLGNPESIKGKMVRELKGGRTGKKPQGETPYKECAQEKKVHRPRTKDPVPTMKKGGKRSPREKEGKRSEVQNPLA